jgi:hypothetical protein
MSQKLVLIDEKLLTRELFLKSYFVAELQSGGEYKIEKNRFGETIGGNISGNALLKEINNNISSNALLKKINNNKEVTGIF